ncbi:hypothetical protein DXO150_20295, partial [Xanthomonas oryzae pv. oryzae]
MPRRNGRLGARHGGDAGRAQRLRGRDGRGVDPRQRGGFAAGRLGRVPQPGDGGARCLRLRDPG